MIPQTRRTLQRRRTGERGGRGPGQVGPPTARRLGLPPVEAGLVLGVLAGSLVGVDGDRCDGGEGERDGHEPERDRDAGCRSEAVDDGPVDGEPE